MRDAASQTIRTLAHGFSRGCTWGIRGNATRDAASQTIRTLAHGFSRGYTWEIRGNALRDAASRTIRTLAHGFSRGYTWGIRGNATRDAASQTIRTLAHGFSRGYTWERNARRGIPNDQYQPRASSLALARFPPQASLALARVPPLRLPSASASLRSGAQRHCRKNSRRSWSWATGTRSLSLPRMPSSCEPNTSS